MRYWSLYLVEFAKRVGAEGVCVGIGILTQYLVDFHLVCKKNETRFREEILTVHSNPSKSKVYDTST